MLGTYAIIHLEATQTAFSTQAAAALSDACQKVACLTEAWSTLTRIHVFCDTVILNNSCTITHLTGAAKQCRQKATDAQYRVKYLPCYSSVRKWGRCFLSHVHASWICLLSISVCPHSPFGPPTLSLMWHWPARGKAETFPSPDCSILEARSPQ